MLFKRRRKQSHKSDRRLNQTCVDWYMMTPCIGIEGVCPPLCKWSDLHDGTYSLYDVEIFHATIDELIEMKRKARAKK